MYFGFVFSWDVPVVEILTTHIQIGWLIAAILSPLLAILPK